MIYGGSPIEYLIAGGALLLMIVGIEVAAVMPNNDSWNRRFFISIHVIMVLCILVSIVDTYVYGKIGLIQAEKISVCLEYLLFSFLNPMMTVYLLHSCRLDYKRSALFWGAAALWGIFLVLLGIAQFTTIFYYYSPEGYFRRGEWNFVLISPILLIICINLLGLLKNRNRISKKNFSFFLICYLVGITVTYLQSYMSSVIVTILGASICSVVMNLSVLSEIIEQYTLQQQEIVRQRVNIMVLQMRPQYIYNTMTSIYNLCEHNPKKAQQVILDFTVYLRKNFSAIASEDTIPFSEELEHTRAYLAVEKEQFEDRLLVEFNVPHIQFRLPPLTLQPIVENSIKYGLDKEGKTLRVSIKTMETKDGSVILVEDNGPGFDPLEATGPNHTLSNIKDRLRLMCHGDIQITSGGEGGTLVKVILPS